MTDAKVASQEESEQPSISNQGRRPMFTVLSVLVLLDLGAALGTAAHNILTGRLDKWVGSSGTVLNWFRFYLADQKYVVSVAKHKPKGTKVRFHKAVFSGHFY